jgi:hypothetical protein
VIEETRIGTRAEERGGADESGDEEKRAERFHGGEFDLVDCAAQMVRLSSGTTPRSRETLEKFSAGFFPRGVIRE